MFVKLFIPILLLNTHQQMVAINNTKGGESSDIKIIGFAELSSKMY